MKKIDKSILQVIKVRKNDSHKGNYGKILIIAGSPNFGGAAIMSASAAIYSGAGLVTLATDPSLFSTINTSIPEVMTLDYNVDLKHEIKNFNVIAIGPGLPSQFPIDSFKEIISNLTSEQTLIIDATAINILSKNISLMNNISAQIILTPHKMEWQRLSQIKIEEQTPSNNQNFINHFDNSPIVILKGHQTHIYYQGNIYQNISGNPGMATGGSGDTLTGILAAFCAQFGNSISSINAAVFLHSDLANQIYQNNYVVLPEKLIQQIPRYMKKAIL